jgi:hypothetical protein
VAYLVLFRCSRSCGPDTYFQISPIVAPIATIIGALIFSVGAICGRFRSALSVIALGSWLLAASNLYWLVVQIQKLSGAALLSRGTADGLFPIQAVCFYSGLCVVIVGDAMLVWRLSKSEQRHHI